MIKWRFTYLLKSEFFMITMALFKIKERLFVKVEIWPPWFTFQNQSHLTFSYQTRFLITISLFLITIFWSRQTFWRSDPSTLYQKIKKQTPPTPNPKDQPQGDNLLRSTSLPTPLPLPPTNLLYNPSFTKIYIYIYL